MLLISKCNTPDNTLNVMKRRELKAFCVNKAHECESMPYSYWRKQSFPFVCEESFHDVLVNVEFVLLEDVSDYLHIAVNVDDGRWFNTIAPVGSSFIVRQAGL